MVPNRISTAPVPFWWGVCPLHGRRTL